MRCPTRVNKYADLAYVNVPASSFLGSSLSARPLCCRDCHKSTAVRHAGMVLPREQRRDEEIKRLTKQLEELKARRAAVNDKGPQDAISVMKPTSVTEESHPTDAQSMGAISEGASSKPVLELLGKHGDGSRFCAITVMKNSEFASRIVAVAGRIPEMTSEQLRKAPKFGGDASDGEPQSGVISWTYIPREFEGELVPLPESDVLGRAVDPVAIRVAPHLVAPNISSRENRDALVIVERNMNKLEFSSAKFYAWDINQEVHIGWFKEMPSEHQASCLGQVLCVVLEESPTAGNAKTCWMEEHDDF